MCPLRLALLRRQEQLVGILFVFLLRGDLAGHRRPKALIQSFIDTLLDLDLTLHHLDNLWINYLFLVVEVVFWTILFVPFFGVDLHRSVTLSRLLDPKPLDGVGDLFDLPSVHEFVQVEDGRF